jgi:hypothetical protein
VSHRSTTVSESGELAPNTPGPGSLRLKAKLIGFISKMMITLRMRSLGLHPHTRIVVASDLIVVVIADAAWHHRPVGPQSFNLPGASLRPQLRTCALILVRTSLLTASRNEVISRFALHRRPA